MTFKLLSFLRFFQINFPSLHSSVLECVLQPKIAKNSLRTPIWGFTVVQCHRCWYHWKARWQCLL